MFTDTVYPVCSGGAIFYRVESWIQTLSDEWMTKTFVRDTVLALLHLIKRRGKLSVFFLNPVVLLCTSESKNMMSVSKTTRCSE